MLRNNEVVSIRVLDRICSILQMQPGDILEFVPDDAPQYSGNMESPLCIDEPLFAASSASSASSAKGGEKNAKE